MTVSAYFNHAGETSEQTLTEDLWIETIQLMGMDLIYVPRDTVDYDYLYAEDPTKSFTTKYTIEAYLKSVDGFGDENELMSSFGIRISDTATFQMSMSRFAAVTGQSRPKEGDLLYMPLSKSLLSIKRVKKEDPFYQNGKLFAFEIYCDLYEYSSEDISTGDFNIDSMITEFDIVTDIDNDPAAENTDLETEGDALIDFSVTNPFGGL